MNITFSKYQIKVFITSLVITFSVVAMQYVGVHLSLLKLISPLTGTKEDVLTTLMPRLTQKSNNYHLKTVGSFISQAAAESSPTIDAKAYSIIDFDSGQIIASSHGDQRVPIASLTKIMTAVVALDIASPEEKFTITQKAADQEPTKIGVVPGEKMSVKELLEGGLMTSANDAIEAIRDGIDDKYNNAVFVRAMNAKAEAIGLRNTHFTNPQGFDNPEHYSSASDLAVLTHYALTNYPLIAQIVKQDYTKLPATSDHKQFDLYNWNGLLDVYPNVSGVKIGNTDNALTTTVVTSERGGKKLLVVVLGAPDILKRDMWASELLDLGYQKTLGLAPVNVTEDQLHAKYATWKYFN
ncbi:hypothetical protein BH09PAT1_BH09PAT1_1140 [soil metagenome]